ncbi:hypothetical protein ACS0TY_030422 [Phlomoides rotata]
MEFSSAVYGAIALSFLFYYLRSAKSKAPPHACGARLITGHFHLIHGGPSDGHPHVNLAALADKHGPAFTIKVGVRLALVVSSPELAKHLFTTAASSHLQTKAAKHLGQNAAVFASSVDLLSSRRIELQRHVSVSETAELVNGIYKAWEKSKDGYGRVRVNMRQRVGHLDLNVALRTVAGKRLSGGDEAEERWRKVMRDFFRLAEVVVVGDAFPHFGWLDVGGYEKRMKETWREMGKIVGGWLAERRRKEYSSEGDFLDVMMSDGSVLGQCDVDSDTIIKATCQSLIVGGSGTTAIMLVRTLSLLLNNRKVMTNCQEELDKHVGRERRVMESDINNLVYLQAIVKEALRLHPPTPLGGLRELTKSCNVGGFHVPKGTWLIVNLWKLQRDPQVWIDNPTEFRPERFLNMQKNLDAMVQDCEFIPFGAGPRVCPEINFCLHLVLANMLQAFELSDDEQVDHTDEMMMNSKDIPLDVLVAPRLSPNLY